MNTCNTLLHGRLTMLFAAVAAVTLAAGLSACGGGGGGDNGAPAPLPVQSPPPTAAQPPSPPPPSPAPPLAGGSPGVSSITASLASGSYLEFLATSKSSSSSAAASSSAQDYGFFRLTLGAPRQIAGVSGYAVAASGKTKVGGHEFSPPWRFIAQIGTRWLGSVDGQTLVTLYDPAMPIGTTGFFLGATGTRALAAKAGRFDGAYNRYQGLAVSDASSEGGCRWVLSYQICSETTTTFQQKEVLLDGIGPVGFTQTVGYVFGGSAPEVLSSTLTLELVGTSLAARDGTAVKPPPWSPGPALPVARNSALAVALGSQVYLFGGTGIDSSFDARRVDRFDVTTRTWQRMPDAPRSLAACLATLVGTRIGLFCGTDGLLYEPATGRWTATARLLESGTFTGVGARVRPDGRTEVIAIVDRGSLYVQATLARYLPDINAWQPLGQFDRGQRDNYQSVMVGNRFVLIGGFGSGGYLSTLSAVEIDTRSVRALGRLLDPVVRSAVSLLGDRIVVAGGLNFGGTRSGVQFIDVATGTVTSGPDLLGGLQGAAAATFNGTVVLFGGRASAATANASADVWLHQP